MCKTTKFLQITVSVFQFELEFADKGFDFDAVLNPFLYFLTHIYFCFDSDAKLLSPLSTFDNKIFSSKIINLQTRINDNTPMRTSPSLILSALMLPLLILSSCTANPSGVLSPCRLRVELLENTGQVWQQGRRSPLSLERALESGEDFQAALINTPEPLFSWALDAESQNDGAVLKQKAFRIRVATSPEGLRRPDVWDSGKIRSGQQSLRFQGRKPLQTSTIYYWNVTVWCEGRLQGKKSATVSFLTSDSFSSEVSVYPLEREDTTLTESEAGLFDFGRDAFSQFSLLLDSSFPPESVPDSITVHIGEQKSAGRVNRHPQGSQRYARYTLATKDSLGRLKDSLSCPLRPDRRNTTPLLNESGVSPILMPSYIGEVYPFRYLEVENPELYPLKGASRSSICYPFDQGASYFHCSDSILNAVWELCKYTVKATSFCGVYVDGDRERIPYEADAIINQLSHYAVDDDYAMARRSVKHLIYNPTWPTEWILQSLIMVWNDYMYTGDDTLLRESYEDLKAKTLLALKEDNGLISTSLGKCTPEFYSSIHFKGKRIRDIVDWPQNGAAGVEKQASGEADGFEFSDFNAVVNAYHYRALCLMSRIAEVLERKADRDFYAARASECYDAFNTLLYNPETHLYTDGIGLEHSSLHSNMFALCFGLVSPERKAAVLEFIKSRSMACSVYGAQFLLDALYDNGEQDYALSLLCSTSLRSWYNMIRSGSTITTEAWDTVFKPNQDWNHPWGAAPANIIVRKLMGIEPVESGFRKVVIRPQIGSLSYAEVLTPTIRGDIYLCIDQASFHMTVRIPEGMEAELYLPGASPESKAFIIGAGEHCIDWQIAE